MLKRIPSLITILFAIFLTSNLIVLDILFFQQKNNSQEKIATPVEIKEKESNCTNCISTTPTISLTPTPTIKPVSSLYSKPPTSQIKDFMISLGSGTGQSNDWTDVPGVGATINSDNYGSIKNVFFEISLNMPTTDDIVSVRLYNVTDKHPVWYSQIDSNGQTVAYLTSQPIKLDSGNKLYQVQMKTLLTDQPASIIQSRIHITTN